MDEQSKARLEAILATDVNALTDEDKAFLHARRDYIPAHLQDQYVGVLAETEEDSQDEEKPKKAKKVK